MSALPLPQRPGMFGLTGGFFRGQPTTEPFVFGRGGRRMSLDDIDLQRRLAAQEMAQAGDFSPVGHWTQGLARALGSVTGGLRMNRANRADQERKATAKAQTEAEIAALLANSGDKQTVLRAIATGGEGAQNVAKLLAEPMFAKPPAPHYWETNDGSLGVVGADGKPTVLYKDPTPKVDYITADNGDGTKQLIPVINGQVMGGGDPVAGVASGSSPTSAPPATLPPDFFDNDKGGPAPAPGLFPGGFRGYPGEQVTSTYRDPAQNRRVGGVPNSYHMRRDPKGNPMARDSVPPPGVSMAEHAAKLRRLNPWAKVINEGDHVHMEPR